MDNKTLPYNCPLVPEWFEEFRDIKECFTYIGGLPYEILKHSGLDTLEIFGFFENRNWEDIDSLKKLRSGTRILALEVYMDLENGAEPRKAYLYSDITEEYYAVFEAGEVVEGKLILKKEKLLNLAGQGYCCIVPTNGKEPEIYRSEYAQIFGLDFMAFEIQPWSDKRRVSSNGYKEVYLILSHSVYLDARGGALATLTEPKNLGDFVFEVDNYALDTCRRLLEQERYIRKRIKSTFFVNQINPYDSEVLQYLRTASEGVFLKEVGYALEDFPECYQRLAYDTAYIRYYFPDIQQEMKLSHSQAECVAVGISMDMSRYAQHCLYAANYMSDGSVHLVKNPKLSEKISDLRACCELKNIHEFPISYDLCNAGVAASELGMVMREILDKNCYQDVANVGISLFKRVPDKEEIQQYMEHQKEFQQKPYAPLKVKEEIALYHELELEEADGRDVVTVAAQLAEAEQVSLYDRAQAILAGYEALNRADALVEGEYAIVFDWRNDDVQVTLMQGEADGVRIMVQEAMDNPMEESEAVIWGNDIYEHLFGCMRSKILEQEEFLKVMNLTESNMEAWRAFHNSRIAVMEQMRRGSNGLLILRNDWACVEEELPYAQFKEMLKPYIEKAKQLPEKVMQNGKVGIQNISKVYLSGNWGNVVYVWECLEEYFGQGKLRVMADTSKAAVIGAAYLAGTRK